jgi:hypothetical protein
MVQLASAWKEESLITADDSLVSEITACLMDFSILNSNIDSHLPRIKLVCRNIDYGVFIEIILKLKKLIAFSNQQTFAARSRSAVAWTSSIGFLKHPTPNLLLITTANIPIQYWSSHEVTKSIKSSFYRIKNHLQMLPSTKMFQFV